MYSDVDLKNKIGEMITGEDGIATYNGIKGGTYYLKEASAPSGYRKINNILTADIKKESCLYRIHVSNTKNGLLPFTGGSGSSSYIVIGGIIILIGTCSMIYYHKKNLVTNE
ncbi:MAG: prealbumin-like fold domain-containing protein [Clostridium sp.]|nr:MAG: prealbumin-like fold domain-containing protein [Clostridium sp.]